MGKLIRLFAVVLILAGCSTDADEPDLLAPQREAMERADDVERVLQEAADRQRRLIDQHDS